MQIDKKLLKLRKRMLGLVWQAWVDGVLKFAEINPALSTGKISGMYEISLHTVSHKFDQDGFSNPDGNDILTTYQASNQSLLIIGAPGAGKTTTLLQLTRLGIRQAESDINHPIPVVFNLASWHPEQKIDRWLLKEFMRRYFVRENVALEWLENYQLMLLLDGLDEVRLEDQISCVKALNRFRQISPGTGMVLCCRTSVYKEMQSQLDFGTVICVEPWNECRNKMERELEKPHKAMRSPSASHPDARESFYRKLSTLQTSHRYQPKQVIRWLSWLAQQMKKHRKTIFQIEEIGSDWLANQEEKQAHQRLVGRILTILGGLFAAVLAYPPLRLFTGTQIGILGAICFGFYGVFVMVMTAPHKALQLDGNAKEKGHFLSRLLYKWRALSLPYQLEPVRFSWGLAIFGAFSGMILIGVIGLTLGIITSAADGANSSNQNQPLLMGIMMVSLFSGIPFGFFTGLFAGLRRVDVPTRLIPNQGLYYAIGNAFIAGLLTSAGSALVGGLLFSLLGLTFVGGLRIPAYIGLVGALFCGLLVGLMAMIRFGGLFFINHLALRWRLYRFGRIPANMTAFLTRAAQGGILRLVGSGFIFASRQWLDILSVDSHPTANESDQD